MSSMFGRSTYKQTILKCICNTQELTTDADKGVRRSDGDASQKLMQQENLLLRAKVAHAKQMLQPHDIDQNLLRSV